MAVMFPGNHFGRTSFARYLTTMDSELARVEDDSVAVRIPTRRSGLGRGQDC